MEEKAQVSFKIDPKLLEDFDAVLKEFKDVTGVKPVRQDSIEVAMKDYIIKLKKQIDIIRKVVSDATSD